MNFSAGRSTSAKKLIAASVRFSPKVLSDLAEDNNGENSVWRLQDEKLKIGNKDPRQRLSIPCAVHGVHYNPSQSSGCVVCEREKKSGIPNVLLLVLLLALALGLVLAVNKVRPFSRAASSGEGNRDQSAVAVNFPLLGQRLDPNTYRSQLIRIEGILSQNPDPRDDRLERILAAGKELISEIRKREPAIVAVRVEADLMGWLMKLDQRRGSSEGAGEMKTARQTWEQFRVDTFEKAEWLLAVDPSAWGPEEILFEVDPKQVQDLRNLLNAIGRLQERGQAQSAQIGDMEPRKRSDPASIETLNRWDAWQKSWRKEISQISSQVPSYPGITTDVDVLLAHRSIESALQDLRSVTAADRGVPPLTWRGQHFANAGRELDKAAVHLKKAEIKAGIQ